MPQSLANIPMHLIWSTKNREPFIKPEIEKARSTGIFIGTAALGLVECQASA
jgi:hypothetical protein